ncbi:MAG: hypothetical protein Q8N98_00465 [bacterium]|nr:hypothetical protein [bacterium]
MTPETSNFRIIGPYGKMAEVLTRFGASPDIQMRFARRAGAVVGGGISHAQFENAILDTSDRGSPCWDKALTHLGQMVNRVYRGQGAKPTNL